MEFVKLSDDLEISRIVHGHWRLTSWNLQPQELLNLMVDVLDLGINTFDHADIYGDYRCEELFGEALRLKPELRSRIRLITKCGIKLLSGRYPERRLKHYDYSYAHIVGSAENSLRKMGTEYIDLLLLHRPAPFFDPEEVSRAFNHLRQSGKVRHFGVSNFSPAQFAMLQAHLDFRLVTNQVEISPLQLDHFGNGNIDFFLQEKIIPMAWSPLAGGRLMNPGNEREWRVLTALKQVAEELGLSCAEAAAYCWLLSHPARIIPVAGSSKMERLKIATEALGVKMNQEQWYRIYTTSTGVDLP